MTADPASDPFVGQLLAGRYEVVRKLNEGGMGAVYLAIQRPLGRPVALKMLLRSLASDVVAVKRFEKEALAVSRLAHGHIITLFDFGTTEAGDVFLAMEYLDGKSLRDLLDDVGFVPWERALHIMKAVTSALAAAHALRIVHRDLKPENVMLVERNGDPDFAKVLDFGLARTLAEESARLTQRDVVPGTPAYMSPERAHGIGDDARADLYALGALWFELLVGEPPFPGDTAIKIILRHIHEPPRAPSVAQPRNAIPPFIDRLVLRLLEKKPDNRPANAQVLLDELETFARPRGWHVAGASDVGRRGGHDDSLAELADALSSFDELNFTYESGSGAPLPRNATPPPLLLTRKKAAPAAAATQPVAVVPLVVTRKTAEFLPAPQSPQRALSLDEVVASMRTVRTARGVGELCCAFLRGHFDRACVLDLRADNPVVLASIGIDAGAAIGSAVVQCTSLLELASRREAYYGPTISTTTWMTWFRALGGPLPGAIFVGGLQRDARPAFTFYADHRDVTLRPDVRDAVMLLREAAIALSRVELAGS